jgi:transglutaminase-like putative cysteine protease
MKRLIIVAAVLISSVSGAHAKTLMLEGRLDSSIAMRQQMEFSVDSGTVQSFSFRFALPADFKSKSVSQTIDSLNLAMDPRPNSSTVEQDRFGNRFQKVVWNNTGKDIRINLSYIANVRSELSAMESRTPFPIGKVSGSDAIYLKSSEMVQSDSPEISDLARRLTAGAKNEYEAVSAITNHVTDAIKYTFNPPKYDALYTLETKSGNCQNFAHLNIALLRSVGIPARIVGGITLKDSWKVPIDNRSSIVQSMGQGGHAWMEIYFPDLGWLPYDPQQSRQFTSSRHIKQTHGLDSRDINDTWSGVPYLPRYSELIEGAFKSDDIKLAVKSTGKDPRSYIISNLVASKTLIPAGDDTSADSGAVMEKRERERVAREKAERERVAQERADKDRIERERVARERVERERVERERVELARAEQERLKKDRLKKERLEAEAVARQKADEERLATEKGERERLAKERVEADRLAKLKADEERKSLEKAESDRLAREKLEVTRLAKLKADKEQKARDKAEYDRLAREKTEVERLAKLKVDKEQKVRDKAENERLAREKTEAERLAKLKAVKPAKGSAMLFGNMEFPNLVNGYSVQGNVGTRILDKETSEYVTSQYIFAQAFNLKDGMALDKVSLAMRKFGGDGNVYIDLVRDEGGRPNILDGVRSNLVSLEKITRKPGYYWVDFSFPQDVQSRLKPGKYWIVFRSSGEAIMNWFYIPGKPYSDGDDTRSTAKGFKWEDILNYDFVFKVAGKAI